jgi:glycosyltransferase involved in cell wall biosynthesis
MITFAIPTWNRAKQLEVCIRSIAEQGGRIVVSDNASTDETPEVLDRMTEEFGLIHVRRELHVDFQDNFKDAFNLPETEWTWTFGDDDILMPGAMALITEVLKTAKLDFIHVAEKIRSEDSKSIVTRPNLFELCSDLGWLDMTGFITCNIVRTEKLKQAVNLPSWEFYSKNAFPQSCGLLEALHDSPAMFIDMPLVDNQANQTTPDTVIRWSSNQTATRYFYVDEALHDMVRRGILKPPIDNVFFRYHSYFLWDRLITCMISQYGNHPNDSHPELWKHVEGLATLLDAHPASVLKSRIMEVRSAISIHYKALSDFTMRAAVLDGLMAGHNHERFGFTYLGEPKEQKIEVVSST